MLPFRLKVVVEMGPGAASNAVFERLGGSEVEEARTYFSVDSARLYPRSEWNRRPRNYSIQSVSRHEENTGNARRKRSMDRMERDVVDSKYDGSVLAGRGRIAPVTFEREIVPMCWMNATEMTRRSRLTRYPCLPHI